MLNKVLKKIKPSKEEESRVKNFAADLIRVCKTISGFDCLMCGSIGKFTWLKGDHDIDLFILFPDVSREELEKKGLDFGKKIVKDMKGKHVIKYAEHPYVHATIRGFNIDIVPCYRIKKDEKIKSAVDRSPLHLEYVLENLSSELRDEIRLLKQFCKGIGVYGSDAKNLGFSGYVCEVMVIEYGSFMNVLKEAANWRAPTMIGSSSVRFTDNPLVLIDPVDNKRNAAANLNAENFVKFVENAKKFVAKPEEKYFFPKKPIPLTEKEIKILKERETKFMALIMKKPDIIDDVLYPQLRRSLKRLENLLKHNEFLVLRSYIHTNKDIIILFDIENWILPKTKKMIGPPIFSKKHSKEFLTKYKKPEFGPYIEGVNWVVEKKREFRDPFSLINDLVKKSIKDLEMNGIPKNIAVILKKAKLIEDKNFWKLTENKEFSAFLREKYF